MADKISTGGGGSVGGNVQSGDFTGRDADRRSQSMNVQFAPNDPIHRSPGVVYTIQEILAQVNEKLDEHSRQLAAIWAKLVQIEFEQAALKREMDTVKQQEQKEREQNLLLAFRFGTLILLIIIVVMLAWMIRAGG